MKLAEEGAVTHIAGNRFSVSSKGGHYEVKANNDYWDCSCIWGNFYGGGEWEDPCAHAIAVGITAQLTVPLRALGKGKGGDS